MWYLSVLCHNFGKQLSYNFSLQVFIYTIIKTNEQNEQIISIIVKEKMRMAGEAYKVIKKTKP